MVTDRLHREEDGFTLVELLAACLVGMVVLFAAFGLLDFAGKSRKQTSDRIEAVTNGRLAMEQITRVLRSQLCISVDQPAITAASRSSVTVIGSLGGPPTESGKLTYEQRRIEFVPISPAPAAGPRYRIVERLYPRVGTTTPVTFATTPSRTRTIAEEVAAADGKPFFRYSRYFPTTDPDAAPSFVALTADPLPLADRQRIVQIEVAFRAFARGNGDARLASAFEDRVFVRTADPTDPTRSPLCT